MAEKDLKITMVQSTLHWENADKNLYHFTQLLDNVKAGSTHLIVLPEMFTTGFSMQAKNFAHETNDTAYHWMQTIAYKKRAVICGSLMFKQGNNYYNRLVWMQPDGNAHYYDKRHLFSYGAEHKTYTPGTMPLIVNIEGVNIKPLICYDLRFPVYSRNTLGQHNSNLPDYDVLLYVANWPHIRIDAWKSLLKARAIENVAYCIGVNRVGTDANGISHSGHSKAFNFKGELLHACKPNKTCIDTVSLSIKELKKFRGQFAALNDADTFTLHL